MRRSTKLMTPTVLASAMLASTTLLAACGNESPAPSAPQNNTDESRGIVAGTLDVRATRPILTLRNTTEFVVGYMVVDKDQMVIALYPPCGQACPTLRQGESTTVAYSAIGGYTGASREAVVMWWRYARQADGTLRPDGGVHTTNVRLD